MSGYILVAMTIVPVPKLQLKTEIISPVSVKSAKKQKIHFLNVKAFKAATKWKYLSKGELLTLEMNKYSSSTWHLKWYFIDPKLCIGRCVLCNIKAYTVSFLSLSE